MVREISIFPCGLEISLLLHEQSLSSYGFPGYNYDYTFVRVLFEIFNIISTMEVIYKIIFMKFFYRVMKLKKSQNYKKILEIGLATSLWETTLIRMLSHRSNELS